MFDLQDLGHEELGEGKQDEENENRSGKSGTIKKRVEVSTHEVELKKEYKGLSGGIENIGTQGRD